jgi:hypothetical protein
MRDEQELTALLAPWAAAAARVESRPGMSCLTPEEILAFLDGGRGGAAEFRAARSRAADHLAECSFCCGEVTALYRARQGREERLRVRRALGERADSVVACVRVLVEEVRGAFTRLDGLVSGLGAPGRLTPPFAAAFGSVRSGLPERDAQWEEEDEEEERLHEVTLDAPGLAGVDLYCTEEEGNGAVTLSLPEPWEVRLVAPDGTSRALAVEAGEERYYATLTGMPPGEYHLAILRPEDRRASPPGA